MGYTVKTVLSAKFGGNPSYLPMLEDPSWLNGKGKEVLHIIFSNLNWVLVLKVLHAGFEVLVFKTPVVYIPIPYNFVLLIFMVQKGNEQDPQHKQESEQRCKKAFVSVR